MLKNLKSLFVVEEETSEKPKTESTDSEKPDSSNSSQSAAPAAKTEGTVDNKIIERLLKIIDDNNLDGFDYLEYKKSLKALEKMPMDEATKYRSAFATASTMGVTLDKLVKTTEHYLGILKSENSNFSTASKSEVKRRVSDKQEQVKQFENLIKEKSEKIKALTKEITKHQKQIESIKNEINQSQQKISDTQLNFEKSYLFLKEQMENDIKKMTQYLK